MVITVSRRNALALKDDELLSQLLRISSTFSNNKRTKITPRGLRFHMEKPPDDGWSRGANTGSPADHHSSTAAFSKLRTQYELITRSIKKTFSIRADGVVDIRPLIDRNWLVVALNSTRAHLFIFAQLLIYANDKCSARVDKIKS